MKLLTFSQEFRILLLGNISAAQWAAALVFSLVGVVISILIFTSNRDKHSPRTPLGFSFGFWLKDNWQRLVLNGLLILVFLRFAPELLGMSVTMILAFFVGFSFDKLGLWLREKNFLDPKK